MKCELTVSCKNEATWNVIHKPVGLRAGRIVPACEKCAGCVGHVGKGRKLIETESKESQFYKLEKITAAPVTYSIQIRGKKQPNVGTSLREVVEWLEALISRHGYGASDIGSRFPIFNDRGVHVATASYNGRLWHPTEEGKELPLPPAESGRTILKQDTVYIGDNGRRFCSLPTCAGMTASSTGRDLSGNTLVAIGAGDLASVGLKKFACECGAVKLTTQARASK